MSAQVWWPLFPLLFLIVLTCLFTAVVRLARWGKGTRTHWAILLLALFFYFLTFALGRWPRLHMPMSNIAEVFILLNVVVFYRTGRSDIAWLNIVALLSIASDFALHFVMK
jgi:hypothetical protein